MSEFNYLSQICAFHKRRELFPINANEMALYFLLLDRANRHFFPEWIPLSGSFAQEELSLSRWAFEQARIGLVSKGYIKYRAGTRGKKPAYHVVSLYVCEECAAPVSKESASPTQSQPQSQRNSSTKTNEIPTSKPAQSQHQDQHNLGDTFYQTKTQTETEKEKPPKGGKKKKSELDIPGDFPPDLRDTLSRWLDYKYERREGYHATGWNALMSQVRRKCGEYSPSAVIDAFNLAMSNNWMGVVWDRLKKGATHGSNTDQPSAGTASGTTSISNRV